MEITVAHLSAGYGKPILQEIHLAIPQGKLVAIAGPNGAGKSTFLKALMGLVPQVQGAVHFFGKSYRQVRKKIAYVPQRSCVDWDFPINVMDVALMGCYSSRGLFGRVRQEDRERTYEVLCRLGLEAVATKQIGELSGGQQQRVFLARALLQNADVFLMDEPFAAVDIVTEKTIIGILKQLQQEGKTILVVHHNLHSVREYFDWGILFNHALIACGPIEEVFSQENLKRAYGESPVFL